MGYCHQSNRKVHMESRRESVRIGSGVGFKGNLFATSNEYGDPEIDRDPTVEVTYKWLEEFLWMLIDDEDDLLDTLKISEELKSFLRSYDPEAEFEEVWNSVFLDH